jgi:carbonic anhydrase
MEDQSSLYERALANNKKWIAEKRATNKDFFKHLAEGQSPEVLYIGCSDSRATAEDLMGAQPGQVFVHRNIGNVVGGADLNAMSVIEFAVGHLHVKHVVVCGHYYCGGVKAAMQARDLGLLNPWLRYIRDVYRIHRHELDAIMNEEQRYRRLVELNVQEQCINVIKTAVVQKTFLRTGAPVVHGWVFDVRTGELIDLKIDFESELKHIREIYDLGFEKD